MVGGGLNSYQIWIGADICPPLLFKKPTRSRLFFARFPSVRVDFRHGLASATPTRPEPSPFSVWPADPPVAPSFCTNDEPFELRAVLAGDGIGHLVAPTAAAHIRAGRLVPLLLDNLNAPVSLFVCYSSRAAQPAHVRGFIDLVVERLADSTTLVLGAEELLNAHRLGPGHGGRQAVAPAARRPMERPAFADIC